MFTYPRNTISTIAEAVGYPSATAIVAFWSIGIWELMKIIVSWITGYHSNKRLEKRKQEQEKIKKSELVADLVAERLSFPEDQTRLNRLSLTLFLRLPDELAKDLSNLLAIKKDENWNDTINVRNFVRKVRNYLNKRTKKKCSKNIALTENDIIVFNQEHLSKKAVRMLNTKGINISEKEVRPHIDNL